MIQLSQSPRRPGDTSSREGACPTTLVVGSGDLAHALGERLPGHVVRAPASAFAEEGVLQRLLPAGRLERLIVVGELALPLGLRTLGTSLPHLHAARGVVVFVTRCPQRDRCTSGLEALARDLTDFGVHLNVLHVPPDPSRAGAARVSRAEIVDSVTFLCQSRGLVGQMLLLDGGAHLEPTAAPWR